MEILKNMKKLYLVSIKYQASYDKHLPLISKIKQFRVSNVYYFERIMLAENADEIHNFVKLSEEWRDDFLLNELYYIKNERGLNSKTFESLEISNKEVLLEWVENASYDFLSKSMKMKDFVEYFEEIKNNYEGS